MTENCSISQGETTLTSEFKQEDDEMNTHLSNATTDQEEEKMYDNSNKTDERNEDMKENEENFENGEKNMITDKNTTENTESNMNKEENNLETPDGGLVDDAIKVVCGFIQKEKDASRKRNEARQQNNNAIKEEKETGINLLISLCEQTSKIEQSEQAKKLLKEKAENLLKEKGLLNGKGRKPEYEEVFQQLFYLCFGNYGTDFKTNSFSQKKRTYNKAYNYCKDKYKDCLDNFDNLKNRLENDGIKSVRFLADKIGEDDKKKEKENEKKKEIDNKKKVFSAYEKLIAQVKENEEKCDDNIEIDGFLITISVSKKSENEQNDSVLKE